jgi:hypothetical protein
MASSAGVTEHKDHKEPLKEKDIIGLGYLKRLFPLLDRLREVGCGRDRAGNRELFYNDYVKLVMLYTWNPLINCIDDLRQAALLPNVAKVMGLKRFSAGSFSESVRIFQPELLVPIIAELAEDLLPQSLDPRLSEFKDALTLVDGTVVRGLPRLVQSAIGAEGRYTTTRDGKGVWGWRLHTQLDLRTLLPHRIDRTGARNGGNQRESHHLAATLVTVYRSAGFSGARVFGIGGSLRLPWTAGSSNSTNAGKRRSSSCAAKTSTFGWNCVPAGPRCTVPATASASWSSAWKS